MTWTYFLQFQRSDTVLGPTTKAGPYDPLVSTSLELILEERLVVNKHSRKKEH